MYCTAAEIIHARRNNKWCQVPFSKMLKIINSYPRVMICKTHELFFARDKVIYHKYSKHRPYLLAATIAELLTSNSLQPRVLEYSVPIKKHWVNPNHQNSCTNEKDCQYLG